ncbi:membrane protein [Stenotrophomonas ginsengisoli]|uniref:Membrane protein n=1 Tax=Stenotrophomonas ginsengisoli TaxID=336566 RepID=A0A0R0CXJ7_9GAMM|nr:cytochrome c biogenesis protein CcsA [Stenotrophomonas ginsengisoli]KRG74473.1 membrane protein [Stenotrophomonas ginsengisoli]
MTIVLIALVLYLLASGLLLQEGKQADRPRGPWLGLASAAVLLHASYHALVAWQTPGGPDMHFFAALSLVGLGMAGLTTVVAARGQLTALGLVAYPLAALLLLAYHLYGHAPSPALGWRLETHAWTALLAYATLAISAVLALMLRIQERALRQRSFSRFSRRLPPLHELETLLFRTITAGFILLSATLLTGVLFVDDLLAQKLVHKTVLSVLSWLVFGTLLLGRWRWGWRGKKAVRLTLIASALLLLAFFGSKAAIELIFH